MRLLNLFWKWGMAKKINHKGSQGVIVFPRVHLCFPCPLWSSELISEANKKSLVYWQRRRESMLRKMMFRLTPCHDGGDIDRSLLAIHHTLPDVLR